MEIEQATGDTSSESLLAGNVPGGALGKDEFLQLLTTQMRNQDPLEPMDSQETISQLAQFSSLEQMHNLNTTFATYRRDDSLLQSLSLNGQTVGLTLTDGTQVSGPVESVTWDELSSGMVLQVNSEPYLMSDIVSLSSW